MIVAAGEALVDMLPGPVPGGGPMNVAVAAARLGAPTAYVGRVSTDAYGDLIWEHLRDAGVDLRAAQRGPEPTCVAEVVGDPPVFVFRGEGTADAAIEDVDLVAALGPGPHVLHGGTLSIFREPGAEVFATLAERNDGLVSLDPNVRPAIIEAAGRATWEGWTDRWLAVTDLLRVSDADAAWMWPTLAPAAAAARMLERGPGAVVVTTAAGATVTTPAGSVHVPARRVAVADTVGAGDSFVGGMLVALVERGVTTRTALDALGLDAWRAVLDFAAAVAAVTVSRVGADPPRRDELPG